MSRSPTYPMNDPTKRCNKVSPKLKPANSKVGGRPSLDLDVNQIRELGKIQCTRNEIAAVMGCSYNLLKEKYSQYIEEGREQGKASLRHKQFQRAMEGNVAMLIWLGKHLLGQRDEIRLSTHESDAKTFFKRLEDITECGVNKADAEVKLLPMKKGSDEDDEY